MSNVDRRWAVMGYLLEARKIRVRTLMGEDRSEVVRLWAYAPNTFAEAAVYVEDFDTTKVPRGALVELCEGYARVGGLTLTKRSKRVFDPRPAKRRSATSPRVEGKGN